MSKLNYLRYLMRNGFSRIWNKQFLIFCLFLLLSTSFWLFQALNEVYEEDYEVPLKIENLPTDVVLTSDIPKTITISLKDKGITLLNYKFGEGLRPVSLNYNSYTNESGHVRMLTQDLMKSWAKNLVPATSVLAVHPDTIDFYYNHGLHKRVPLKQKGQAKVESGYVLADVQVEPDSVTVYASGSILDEIQEAYVQTDFLKLMTQTTTLSLPLQGKRGAKFIPDSAKVTLVVDRLVEKKLKSPILSYGFPNELVLLPIPQEVEITFQVGMDRYREIVAEDFEVVVNYTDLPTDGSTRCPLSLKKVPQGVSRVRILPKEVDYVIEEIVVPQ